MQFRLAVDLHAPVSTASDVWWRHARQHMREADQLDFVLPDHPADRGGENNGYPAPGGPGGVGDATTIAAPTSTIGMSNKPPISVLIRTVWPLLAHGRSR
jgi:hypothetical protein